MICAPFVNSTIRHIGSRPIFGASMRACISRSIRSFASLALFWVIHATASGQAGVTTFGIQVKPVIPFTYIDSRVELAREHFTGSVELNGGFAFGMSVRIGLTKAISLETGLSQIQRRYSFTLNNDTSNYSETAKVRYVGYELPITALVFIRLGERSYMNAAIGLSADFYPSDAQRDVERGRIYMFRNRWVQLGVLGNLGVEYRTLKSGTFYLGATFHRPFNPLSTVDLTYYGPSFFPYVMRGSLSGAYLTADIRYYFHEDPAKRIRKKTKKK